MSSKTTKITAPKHAVKATPESELRATEQEQLLEALEEALDGGPQDGPQDDDEEDAEEADA